MNVLILIQGFAFGGPEKGVYDMIKFINKNEVDINLEICCYDTLGYFAEKLFKEKEKIAIHFLPRRPGVDIIYPFKLASLIKKRKIDLVNARNATAWFYGIWASILSRTPIVYTEHDRIFPPPLHLKCLHYFFSKHTKAIITVSNAIKENFKKYEYIRKVQIIYNAVDPDLFCPPSREEKKIKKQELGFDESDIILGNVGRMDYWKNQRVLIQILPDIKRLFPQSKLVLAGSGVEEDNLKKLVDEKGLNKYVLFLGQLGNIHDVLKSFDIFVFPSMTEGLPRAVIEAMATGLPVVSSPVGGIPELIINGENGFLVSPTSETENKDAILKLLQNSELRQNMGEISRKNVEAFFSIAHMVKSYLKIYQEVLS